MKDRCDLCSHTKYCTIKRTYKGIECPSYQRKDVDEIVEDVSTNIAYLNRKRRELIELKETIRKLEDEAMDTMIFLKRLPDGQELSHRISERIKVKV